MFPRSQMRFDDALRQRGFRRWYERQLIESHAYLVTAIISLVMVAIAAEMIGILESVANAVTFTAIVLGGGWLFLFAWTRFTRMLGDAEAVAEQAVCATCGTYGRLQVIEAHDSEDAVTGRSLTVRCRTCAHEWHMG